MKAAFVPDQEGLREALCALGNGYFVDPRRRPGLPRPTTSTIREPYRRRRTIASTSDVAGRRGRERGPGQLSRTGCPSPSGLTTAPGSGWTTSSCSPFRQELDLQARRAAP
ncbi:MAG: hypothetical protein U5K56_00105 [Halioglobus sp.]|nr:hypothetical protein [Halioglobus sp.]